MGILGFYLHMTVTRSFPPAPQVSTERRSGNLDLYPELRVMRPHLTPVSKMEGINKMQSLIIIPEMSRFQMKITHHTKRQKNLKLNEKDNQIPIAR